VLRAALRHVQLGLGLGIAALLLGMFLYTRVEGLARSALGPSGPSPWAGLVYAFLGQLPALAGAPLVAFAAGLYFEASRWRVAVTMLVAVQGFALAAVGLSAGAGLVISPVYLAIVASSTAAGIWGSAFAMGAAQRLMKARADARRVPDEKGVLARMDFEAIQRSQVQSAGGAAAPSDPPEPGGGPGPGPTG